jgi:two-component system, cell cycle sensor histidine kinase and response regulator CckA
MSKPFESEALWASESMSRLILETTDQGIYGVDKDGRCTYINESALTLLGYQREECLGRDIHELIHHSYADGTTYPRENCPMHRAKLAGTSCRIDDELLWSKNGTLIPVEYCSRPLIDNGEDIGAVVTFTDISERKRLMTRLELSRKEAENSNKVLNAILENMADWVWEVNAEGRYVYCSPHVEGCLGYTPDEIIGKTPFDLMPPEEVKRLGAKFVEVCRLKLPIKNVENWNIAKDGRRRLLLTNGVPIIDENGLLTGYRGVDRDITDLKHLETELLKLSRAVTQSPVSIVITDLNGTIEFVNPRFSELTGYTAEEAIGQNPRILNSGQTPPETVKSMWATLSSGDIWEGEFHNKGKHGQQFWEHAVISSLRDESGTITHYLAVKENITEKKRVLEQLVNYRIVLT